MEKKVKTVLYKPPTGNPYLMKVRVKNTKYVKENETGHFEGRKRVKKGDDIKRNRVKKPFVLVRQSRTARGYLRKNREEHNPGEFF
jgi:hypothetical protein